MSGHQKNLFCLLLVTLFNIVLHAQNSPCTDSYIKSVTRALKTKRNYALARDILLQMKQDCASETPGHRTQKTLDSLIDLVEKATGNIVRERSKDTDGDGFPDDLDQCPEVYSKFNNGCPVTPATNNNTIIHKTPESVSVTENTGRYEGRVAFVTKDTIRYDGYAKAGLFDGMGYVVFADNDTYTGEFSMGRFNGYGEYTYRDGSVYTGFWTGNEYDGIGRLRSRRDIASCANCKTYSGYFRNGLKSGWGRCYDADMHLIHEGMFENDMPVGIYPNKNLRPFTRPEMEVISLKDGGRFMGYTKDGKQEGRGTYRLGSRLEYVGEWEHGYYEGDGSFLEYGVRYSGDWKKGVRSGFGAYDLGNGLVMRGAFRNDMLNGQGAMLSSGQSPDIPLAPAGTKYFIGTFVNGRKEGMGRCYDKFRKLIYEGPFKADRPVGKSTKK